MDCSGKQPTSERRLVAAPEDDRLRIEHALANAESHVARMQASPATQHLKNVLESCRRTLARWRASPPTDYEIHALGDRVGQTLQVARTTSPTLRLRRPA